MLLLNYMFTQETLNAVKVQQKTVDSNQKLQNQNFMLDASIVPKTKYDFINGMEGGESQFLKDIVRRIYPLFMDFSYVSVARPTVNRTVHYSVRRAQVFD